MLTTLMILWLTAMTAYFLPWIIALLRGRPNASAIFVLNFLTGWTFVGWIVALVWAIADPTPIPIETTRPMRRIN